MKIVLIIVLMLSMPVIADGWIEGSTIAIRAGNTKYPSAIFLNTYTGTGIVQPRCLVGGEYAGYCQPAIPPDTWTRIDLQDLGLPFGTAGVFLSGILIITHGKTPETCNLTVSFRAPGDDLPLNAYSGQTLEAVMGSGSRTNMAVWVPTVNEAIEFAWHRSTSDDYPTHCAYAVNLSLQAYIR